MAEEEQNPAEESASAETQMQGGAYEVLRKRLMNLNGSLCEKLEALNLRRKEVFGGNESHLIGNERIITENNCVPRDITGIGNNLIFGYNVFFGLRTETKLSDVFSVHTFDGTTFSNANDVLLSNPDFVTDFKELYKYYKSAKFLQFIKSSNQLLLIFQVGQSVDDIKIFRFAIDSNENLSYVDNRGDMDYKKPPQHDFEWIKTGYNDYVQGEHPHVSIQNKVFVECVGGDLTIKIEDNTSSGEGIYAEPVENADQTLDDGEIYYAEVGNLILLKMLPYREEKFRYFVYNCIKESATRIESLDQSGILLPEGHGIIFPKGYYLQDGVYRLFDDDVDGMQFLECIKSPNGEDFLYVFYHEEHGKHILIQYNLISKELATPIFCNGYSTYDDGKVVLFSSPDDEPKRNHPMQIWDTPFYGDGFEKTTDTTSYLATIGNRDLVRGISEGYSISRKITAEELNLLEYQELIKSTQAMTDGYHWLSNDEANGLATLISEIRDGAIAAVNEFEKVVLIRKNTEKQLSENEAEVKKIILDNVPDSMLSIDAFVRGMTDIRTRRGVVISLKELRYTDLSRIDEMDKKLETANTSITEACIDFLLTPEAMTSYTTRNDEILVDLNACTKIAEIKPLAEDLEKLAEGLDLLTDMVNNLAIDDATKTTQIVDKITDVYAAVNRTRATVKNLRKSLGKAEAEAEFAAQYKLLSQSITNYIGMCDSVEKCEEYLTKVMISIEDLEGTFADFDEYVIQLTEKREEAYNAFTGRKQSLEEEQKRKVTALLSSAERILTGIINRASTFKSIDEVNAYFASDIMVGKLRDIIVKLTTMGDSVKSDDLTGRLKSSRDEITRRLRDKLDLFDEDNVIKFGDYKFNVNTQQLELTTLYRDKEMYFHLTGTDFYELIENEEFLSTRQMWDQELISECPTVYRAEYLAYQVLMAAVDNKENISIEILRECVDKEEGLEEIVQRFASSRYNEGYDKGIHDFDATLILTQLVKLYTTCKLLRYDSEARGYAVLFWAFYDKTELKNALREKMRSYGSLPQVFGLNAIKAEYVQEVRAEIDEFYRNLDRELDQVILDRAAEFLYFELQDKEELEFTINTLALELQSRFTAFLKDKKAFDRFNEDLEKQPNLKDRINLTYDWVDTYIQTQEKDAASYLTWELVALLVVGDKINRDATSITTFAEAKGLMGQHSLVEDKILPIYFDRFLLKMKSFTDIQVPMYEKYVSLRTQITEQKRGEMRLSEFKPRVMGGFVRNKLINDVYLNLIGANFAKQMGVAGESKRTDLMGLLLLISPPGYGKTTLMEYISNRLGLTFMKINGPAIGHKVTSLDPAEAPNATAREELYKLNLSLEMGNNVMIYLDDIQHLNPEFLQKFISLCDAQRKIEGVYKGTTRTYDLRGKKVAVVMAGNPYTESGGKFQIPDMLSNRADTYNLGDISSTNADVFNMSFIENSMTSNTVLNVISSRGHSDLYKFMQVAERGSSEGVEFNYNYSAAEVDEITNVLKKMYMARDVVLRNNQQYIYSAAQEDDYRTEPGFKLQGSYRNMNKISEKIFPVMTEDEVQQIIEEHYFNEAQTLTTGAESNLLKFKEMNNIMSEQERERWEDIKGEFNRRQTLSGVDDSDDIGKVIAQLSTFGAGMGAIKNSLDRGLSNDSLGDLIEAIKGGGLQPNIDLSALTEVIGSMTKQANHEPQPMPAPTINTDELSSVMARQAEALEAIAYLIEGFKGLNLQASSSSHSTKNRAIPNLNRPRTEQ